MWLWEIQIQLPTKQDQERRIKEMEQFDELDRLQKAHLTRLETLIKQRFGYRKYLFYSKINIS